MKFSRIFYRKKTDDDHEKVEHELGEHEHRLDEVEKRLLLLELEAGIYKPPLRRVENC